MVHLSQDLADDICDKAAVIGTEGQWHTHVEGIGKYFQCPRKLLNLAEILPTVVSARKSSWLIFAEPLEIKATAGTGIDE